MGVPVPEVSKEDMLGEISLSELNEFNWKHSRQLISVFGTIFDVTGFPDKYGEQGMYRQFAGHDITLLLGSGCLDSKYRNYFVSMNSAWTEAAESWLEFYKKKYPVVGTLKKWKEDTTKWRALTISELQ